MRKIKIANAQKRDAEIVYGGLPRTPKYVLTLPDGERPRNVKVLKSTTRTQYAALLAETGSDEALAQALIAGDPEIDLAQTGRFISGSQRILVNPDKQPIYKVRVVERVHNADGSVKEEKEFAARSQNIVGDFPVAWTGKKMPIAQAYNRFIFGRKYQLSHTSGLTYDFLYAMAKELHDSQSLMLMAAGAKGNEPLIFQENGKPYRAFLEGRIDGDKYLLLMHLSNLELKSIL